MLEYSSMSDMTSFQPVQRWMFLGMSSMGNFFPSSSTATGFEMLQESFRLIPRLLHSVLAISSGS